MSNPLLSEQQIHIHTARHTTCFSGYLEEGINATLSIVALGGQRGDVVPAHGFDNVHHGLGLIGIRRHHTGEELVAAVITQLRGSGGVADLGDLRHTDGSVVMKEWGQVENMSSTDY